MSDPNRPLDQTDADNFYLAQENHKVRKLIAAIPRYAIYDIIAVARDYTSSTNDPQELDDILTNIHHVENWLEKTLSIYE